MPKSKSTTAKKKSRKAKSLYSKRDIVAVLKKVVDIANSPDGEPLWDILTALRGPDNGGDKLKYLTTARLRAVLGLKDTHSFMVRELPLDGVEREKRESALGMGLEHFSDHYMWAVTAIRDLLHYDLFLDQPVAK